MILYFSGTGNSAYAAKRIGREIGDEWTDLFEKLRKKDFSPVHSQRPFVIVAPTYAWRLPHIVEEWIANTPFTGNKKIYFILTCGGSIGNAGKYLLRLCRRKGLEYLGCMGITMPENYIALFSTPAREQAEQVLDQAEPVIDQAAGYIQKGEPLPKAELSFKDNVNSGIVNTLFYPLFVHARKFYAADSCVSCGRCAQVCPLGNIRIKDGKPVWGDACTHCMACICRCPKEAIEYGKHTQGLARYTCRRESGL